MNSPIDSNARGAILANKYMNAKPKTKPAIRAGKNLKILIFAACLKQNLQMRALVLIREIRVHPRRKLAHALHHHRNPLPPANARRGQPIFLLPSPQLIQQRNHQPRPGRAQRMPERNRPAIHVHLLAV
jgi:hypothetical protein